MIDGALALSGTDPLDMPFRRLLSVTKRLWLESYPAEVHEELRLLLAWPEEREAVVAAKAEAERVAMLEEQDSDLRRSAAVVGRDIDKMYESAVANRAKWLAVQQENERQAAAKRIRDAEAEVLHTSPREWAEQAAAEVLREQEEVSSADHR